MAGAFNTASWYQLPNNMIGTKTENASKSCGWSYLYEEITKFVSLLISYYKLDLFLLAAQNIM